MKFKKAAADAVATVEDLHPVNKAKSLTKFVPNPVSRKAARVVLHGRKHSPTVLFAVGVGAGVATVVTACRSTLKLESVLDEVNVDIERANSLLAENNPKYSAKDHKHDLVVLRVRAIVKLGRLYLLPAGLGVLSVAALTGSHHILNKRNAAVSAAYAAVEKSMAEYRKRVADEFGEDKERELRYGVKERTVVTDTKNGPKKEVIKTFGEGRSPYARVYDEVTARNWKPNAMTNRTWIQVQQNWANDLLKARGYVFLNDVFGLLGLEPTPTGQIVGWLLGGPGDDYIDFGIFNRMSDQSVYEFMTGEEQSVLLDFNVNGKIYDLI